MEWSPSRRGTLASGGDDSLVLVWDLLNQGNAAAGGINGTNSSQQGGPTGSTGGAGAGAGERSPAAMWQCEYEVGNLSWAPQSGLTSQGADWIGVAGGRGIWGVSL